MVGPVLRKTSSSLYYEVYDKLMNAISTNVDVEYDCPGECSPEKDCCWQWLGFQQPMAKPLTSGLVPSFSQHNLRLVISGCCLHVSVTKFQDKFASLRQVNSSNSWNTIFIWISGKPWLSAHSNKRPSWMQKNLISTQPRVSAHPHPTSLPLKLKLK